MSDYSDAGSELSDAPINEDHFGSDKDERDILDDESVDGSFVKGGKKAPVAIEDEDEFSDGDEDDVSFDEDEERSKDDYFGGKSFSKQEEKKTLAKASIL